MSSWQLYGEAAKTAFGFLRCRTEADNCIDVYGSITCRLDCISCYQ
jgi:hypothetical protein